MAARLPHPAQGVRGGEARSQRRQPVHLARVGLQREFCHQRVGSRCLQDLQNPAGTPDVGRDHVVDL